MKRTRWDHLNNEPLKSSFAFACKGSQCLEHLEVLHVSTLVSPKIDKSIISNKNKGTTVDRHDQSLFNYLDHTNHLGTSAEEVLTLRKESSAALKMKRLSKVENNKNRNEEKASARLNSCSDPFR